MFTSFSTALSALGAHTTAIDVVGNNLANLNTPGYKSSVVSFSDLVTQSLGAGLGETQVGFGVARPVTIRQFSQGAIQASSGPLDVAIQGDGFLVVREPRHQQRALHPGRQPPGQQGRPTGHGDRLPRAGLERGQRSARHHAAARPKCGASRLAALARGHHELLASISISMPPRRWARRRPHSRPRSRSTTPSGGSHVVSVDFTEDREPPANGTTAMAIPRFRLGHSPFHAGHRHHPVRCARQAHCPGCRRIPCQRLPSPAWPTAPRT